MLRSSPFTVNVMSSTPGPLGPFWVRRASRGSPDPSSVTCASTHKRRFPAFSVDQGGCIETTRPTTYDDPTYVWEGVTHYGVTNMPGAVPRTASQALCAALIPYVLRLAKPDWHEDASLRALTLGEAGR